MPSARSPASARSRASAAWTPARLRAAPVHWPRPSALDVSIRALDGVGPKLAEAAAEAGIETVWRPAAALPAPPPQPPGAPARLASSGGDRDGPGRSARPGPRRGPSAKAGSRSSGSKSATSRATCGRPGSTSPGSPRSWTPGPSCCSTGKLSGKGLRGPRVGAGQRRRGRSRTRPSSRSTPATEALRPQRIREWAEQAVALAPNAVEGLPAELRARRGLGGVGDAIRAAHFPDSEEELEAARRAARLRRALPPPGAARLAQTQPPGGATGAADRAARRAASPAGSTRCPFEPTADQLAAFDDLDADLDSGEPMARLLDGRGRLGEDGGRRLRDAAGARSRLPGGADGADRDPRRAARDHPRPAAGGGGDPRSRCSPGRPRRASRRRALDQLASGELGTDRRDPRADRADRRASPASASSSSTSSTASGSSSGAALDAKGVEGLAPHVLHMTATPIPRTLSLTAYGDLDTTALHQLPAGRQPIETRLVEEEQRGRSLRVHAAAAARGAPGLRRLPAGLRIGESDRAGGRRSRPSGCGEGELRDFRVGLLHGQMRSDREGRGDARLRRRRDRRAGGDDGDRGRDRRRQRDRDGDRGGRALRRLPAAPAARPGRPRRAPLAVPALRRRGGRAGAAAAARRSRARATASSWPRSTWRCAARARSSAPARRARPASPSPSCPRTKQLLFDGQRRGAGAAATRYGSLEDPALGPLLEAARRRFGAGAADPIPL